jgi:hypothetical protein
MADALNQTRRSFLSSTASAGALLSTGAIVAMAAAPSADTELFALEAEIRRLNEAADHIGETCVKPFEDEFWRIIGGDRRRSTERERLAAAAAFDRETGRDAAIMEQRAINEQADALFARMMELPATTAVGRAAKVRALLVHVLGDDWRGPAVKLDWHRQKARALLGQFAGMSAEELAAV